MQKIVRICEPRTPKEIKDHPNYESEVSKYFDEGWSVKDVKVLHYQNDTRSYNDLLYILEKGA